MARTISEKEVEDFLARLRYVLSTGKVRMLRRNVHRLAPLGLTLKTACLELKELKADECYKNPEPDRDYPDKQCWFFHHNFGDSKEAYIKISEPKHHPSELDTTCVSFAQWDGW